MPAFIGIYGNAVYGTFGDALFFTVITHIASEI